MAANNTTLTEAEKLKIARRALENIKKKADVSPGHMMPVGEIFAQAHWALERIK